MGSPVFLPPQKQTLQNSNLTRREDPHKPANADVASSPNIVIYLLPQSLVNTLLSFSLHYILYTIIIFQKRQGEFFFVLSSFGKKDKM